MFRRTFLKAAAGVCFSGAFSKVGAASWSGARGVNCNFALAEEDLVRLRSLNCCLVRQSFAFRPLISKEPPYHYDEEMFRYLRWLVDRTREYGIKIVLDPHTSPGFRKNTSTKADDAFWYDSKWHDYLIDLWGRLAKEFRDDGDVLIGYDLVNEPTLPRQTALAGASDYGLLIRRLIEEVRRYDLDQWLIVQIPRIHGGGTNGIGPFFRDVSGMPQLVDERLVYSFHMYWPFRFTFSGLKDLKDGVTTYPGRVGRMQVDKSTLQEVLEPIRELGIMQERPIFVGEFSAVRWLGDSGNEYLRDLIDIFEQYRWSWAYHAFRSAHMWDAELSNFERSDKSYVGDTPRIRLLNEAFKLSKCW
ncbi:MAG: cellulase family glycosylhydrolase [Gammaproteobacteria bacterium]|nr:cellulase family glycosylhydrolase [Gammaproteobacteria bacterium]